MYRLNYGNGQVSEDFASRKAAVRAYNDQRRYSAAIGQSSGYLRVQRCEGYGEWVSVTLTRNEAEL